MPLSDLAPLMNTPRQALEALPADGLSPAAAVILAACLSGHKPVPPDGGFYMVNSVRSGSTGTAEYLYHDRTVAGVRQRSPLGRLRIGAQELADAASGVTVQSDTPVDVDALALVLKPTLPRKRPFVTRAEQRRRILRALDKYRAGHDGISPTLKELAEMTGLNLSTIRSHVRSMERDGILVRSGRRTLRRAA